MSTRRESWYWCTFTSRGHRLTGAVPAWSAEAAAEQFEAEVRGETDEAGTLTVEPGLGRLRDVERAAPRSPDDGAAARS
jgi:hypothetical protein